MSTVTLTASSWKEVTGRLHGVSPWLVLWSRSAQSMCQLNIYMICMPRTYMTVPRSWCWRRRHISGSLYVDDGLEVVSVVDLLVHQTVFLSSHFSLHHKHSDQGMYLLYSSIPLPVLPGYASYSSAWLRILFICLTM